MTNSESLKRSLGNSKLPSVTAFPGRYIQGPGSLRGSGQYLKLLGDKLLVFGGKRAMASVENSLFASLQENGIAWVREEFCGECTNREIERLVNAGRAENVKAVVGIGGGKAIDAAKVVACDLNLPVGVIPTVASTDAPTSALSVIYHENGLFSCYRHFTKNPEMVLVDTEVIAQSPIRYLVAGIGGAMGISYEAEACHKSGASTVVNGRPSLLAIQCARMIKDVLLMYGATAKVSCEMGVWTPALERVVEANFLYSGIGFESGGLAVAHSIYHGYRNIGEKGKLHGEVVAFGTLVQMIIEGRPEEEVMQIGHLFKELDLPYQLAHLGLDFDDREKIYKLSTIAWEKGTAANMPCDVDPDKINAAVLLADYLGRNKI